jgi:hypothetical protein
MKKFVMLRGRKSGVMVVVSRKWYLEVMRAKSWDVVGQNDDKNALLTMANLSGRWRKNVQQRLDEYEDWKNLNMTPEGITNVSQILCDRLV